MKRILAAIIAGVAATASAQTNPPFANRVSGTDRLFLRQSDLSNSREIELSQLAQAHSSDTNVQSYATLLVSDDSAALAQVQMLASNLDVSLPSTNRLNQSDFNRLQRLDGTQFDNYFLQVMVRDQTRQYQAYAYEASRGRDVNVRNLARVQLPVLSDHLVIALTIQEVRSGSISPTNIMAYYNAGLLTSTNGTNTLVGATPNILTTNSFITGSAATGASGTSPIGTGTADLGSSPTGTGATGTGPIGTGNADTGTTPIGTGNSDTGTNPIGTGTNNGTGVSTNSLIPGSGG